jgi:predicted nucleic acid-binding protein
MSKEMFLNSDPALNNNGKVGVLLIELCEVFLGVRPENTKTNVYKYATERLIELFNGITLKDIENAFKTFKKGEKTYFSLTVDEIINIISIYWRKKQAVKYEINEIELKREQELQREREAKEFKRNSIIKYKEALKDYSIELDEFESYTIAKKLAEKIHPDIKKDLFEKAKKIHAEKSKDENVFNIVPSENYIYAKMIVKYSINKKIKYDE